MSDAAGDDGAGGTRWRARAGLAVVGLGASVAPLDFAVNIAFPAIVAAFDLPTRSIRWAAICYVLTYGALMLGFGALGDRIGHLRVFRAGLWVSAIAFASCALAPDYGWLLAARVLQGVAVALLLSCAPALCTLVLEEHERTRALSAFASAQALAGALAPVAGGVFVALLGWPGVYWMRVPIALAALACLRFVRPAPGRTAPSRTRRSSWPSPQPGSPPRAFDAGSSLQLAAAVGLLLLGPSLALPGSASWSALPVTLAGAAAMATFVLRQRRSDAPFLPAAVAADRGFRRLNVAAVVLQLGSFAVPLVVPFLLLRGGGWTPAGGGMLLSVWALGTLFGSGIAPWVIRRAGIGRAAPVGAGVALAGLATIAAWPADPAIATMVASLALQGAGVGLFQVAYSDGVVAALPPASRGVAGSLTMFTRTVGVVIGASLWTGLLQAFEARALAAGATPDGARVDAFALVFAVAAGGVAAFLVATALRRGAWTPGDPGATRSP